MKSFFTTEEFSEILKQYVSSLSYPGNILETELLIKFVDLANAKLEREGKVVYGTTSTTKTFAWTTRRTNIDTHKALIICIEPLGECPHKNVEKKSSIKYGESWYKCADCGIDLKPLTFGPA